MKPYYSLLRLCLIFAGGSLLCVPAIAQNPTVGYWRFEDGAKGFLADSGSLSIPLVVEARMGEPQQVTLPQSGAGSTFLRATNHSAALFVDKNEANLHAEAKEELLHLQEFTAEALVHLRTANEDAKGQVIVASGAFDESGGSWMLSITGETSPRGARHLMFAYQFAPGPWATENRVAIDSGLQLKMNTDYFVAVAFNAADTAKSGLAFYLQDLTNKAALETAFRSHPQEATSVEANQEGLRIGNLKSQKTGWDGLIDEVRVSNRQLAESELLINAPEFR